MKTLVLALAGVLGWAAYRHLSRTEPGRRFYGTTADAFPFPTALSQASIDLTDEKAVAEWCRSLECDTEQLRAAVKHAGSTFDAVHRHLNRRR